MSEMSNRRLPFHFLPLPTSLCASLAAFETLSTDSQLHSLRATIYAFNDASFKRQVAIRVFKIGKNIERKVDCEGGDEIGLNSSE